MNRKMKMLLLNGAGLFMSCGNIAGLNPVGLAFMASMFGSGTSALLSIGGLVIGMALNFEFIAVIKYSMILAVIVTVSKLISSNVSNINEYALAVITSVSMLAVEIGDVFMSNNVKGFTGGGFPEEMYIFISPIVASVLSGGLVVVFLKGINAFLKGKSMYDNEELFGIATIVGLMIFNIGQTMDKTGVMLLGLSETGLNLIIANTLLFFSIAYGAYKYGAGAGAVMGAAGGIAFCVLYNDPKYLGVICLMGIVAGMFRELGRVVSVLSLAVSCTVIGAVFFPVFISEGVIKALLAAVVVFVLLPEMVVYRIEERENDIETEKLQKICEEKLLCAAKTLERLANSIILKEKEVNESAIHTIWQDKYDESKKLMSGQLLSISKMMEEYSKEVYNFVGITEEDEENICHSLKTKKVFVDKIVGIENKHRKREYLVTAKCQKGITVGTRDVAKVISEVFGKEFVPAKNCRKILSNEYTTTTYVEKANFYVSHGSAKMARGLNGISGDNYSLRELENGQVLMGISDGMGYGASANLESETVIELLEQLLDSGVDGEVALKMINSVMLLNNNEEHPATLDYGVIDLNSGVCDLVKIGAAATFLRRGNWVEMIKSTTMPLGMFGEPDFDCASKKLYSGDEIIMVSDGVLDAMAEENKEEKMVEIINGLRGLNPDDMAEAILNLAVSDKAVHTDDMTVLVTKIWNNETLESKKIA